MKLNFVISVLMTLFVSFAFAACKAPRDETDQSSIATPAAGSASQSSEEGGETVEARADEQKQLRISRVIPTGEDIPAAREIVFQFNRNVVPIGRMEREDSEVPVTITPPINCQWRWINTSSLSCNLNDEDQLDAATKYSVVMEPGLFAEDGATLGQAYRHDFITQRPELRYQHFKTWRSPSSPVIRLTFNQYVAKASVWEYLYLREKDNPQTKYDLWVAPDPNFRSDRPRFIDIPGEDYTLDFGPQSRSVSKEPVKKMVNKQEARRVWLVSPKDELPLDSDVELYIEPGLLSAAGAETGVEDRMALEFRTFPEFEFLGVQCRDNYNDELLIKHGDIQLSPQEVDAQLGDEEKEYPPLCNPLDRVGLAFSTPVMNNQVKDNVILTPDLTNGRADYDPWANYGSYSILNRPHRKDQKYTVWFPEKLKAYQDYALKTVSPETAPQTVSALEKLRALLGSESEEEVPAYFADEFNQTLKTPIDLKFFTDHRPPNFKIAHQTVVLENEVESEASLYVTNIDDVEFSYKSLTAKERKTNAEIEESLPKVEDVQYAIPMRVREALGDKSGAIFGHIETEPYVRNKGQQSKSLFAIVTPYQIHVKMGHHNTLVWVTDLKTGEPVEGADVQIYKDRSETLSDKIKTLDKAVSDSSGLVRLKGTVDLDPNLSLFKWCSSDPNECERFFVRIDKGDEMGLMPLDSRFIVNLYRASNYTVNSAPDKQYSHIHSWGTTAQGVYRAGEKIDYKFYVRDQSNDHYVPAPAETYSLSIVDPTGKSVHEVETITLSEFGSYAADYQLPKTAAVGWYDFILKGSFATDFTWKPMRVLVSDFTPSPFKVSNQLNGDLFKPNDEVQVFTQASLHSGGAYTDAQSRINAKLRATRFTSKDPVASKFRFSSYRHEPRGPIEIFEKIETIGDTGEIEHGFTLSSYGIVHGRLSVESAVRDDRGKYVADLSRADYMGVDRLVGLHQTKWVYDEGKPAVIEYIVVDEFGKPVSGTNVDIQITRQQVKVSKVKGAGNTYLNNYVTEWVPAGECKGTPKAEVMECEFTPQASGNYKIVASIKDSKKRVHSTEVGAWVVGKGRVNWQQADDNSLQIIPEKTDYKIGDTARYLIKNPYPGAKALITIERYGVLKSWVETLEVSTPVIEFEVDKDYLPGFYLSVMVTSPRVDAPLPKLSEIDLGKPSFKLGYLKVPVKDPYKQMDVTIETDEPIYRPRDTVSVKFNAQPKFKDKDEKVELAVVVLDESVLALVQGGKTYFDPYEGFNKLDGLDLQNYSLLTQLLGRQKFEKKGANPGGDGGSDISVRNLFKYVSYWNPSIIPDADGNAEISFEAPDNLTGWRVLALAVTPTDRMGLGQANFKVNKPTELRPIMPNQVTEGDMFQAGFNVMNRTDKTREINVTIEATGSIKAGSVCPQNTETTTSIVCSFSKTIELAPYKRETVYMPITARILEQKSTVLTGNILFAAKAYDDLDSDGLEHSVRVGKRRSLVTAANYGATSEGIVSESLLFPKGIFPDIGGISVTLSPSVIGNIEGAFRYIQDYSYRNWENKLTKGIMASHYEDLSDYLPEDLVWPKSSELIEGTLSEAANYQAPNGGMVYYVPQNSYVSPYLSAYTALVFNWMHDSGQEDVPSSVEEPLHAYLQNLLRKDVVPTFYSRGMSSTVRAVTLAALSEHGKINLDDLERYRKEVQYMSLFGKAHYLQAALNVEGAEEIATELSHVILSHGSQTGGKFSFNEELDDSYSRILATPARANCAILSALTQYAQTPAGGDLVGDVPFKLTRSITQSRGKRNHWQNTQENIFCMNGLITYARAYESVTPKMTVTVDMDGEPMGQVRFKALTEEAVTLERSMREEDEGAKGSVTITREGEGQLYYATRMQYAPTDDFAKRLNAGLDVRKEYSVERSKKWVKLKESDEIDRGELVRVDIFVSLPTARNFVVVDDPLPGGLETVNRDLATASTVDADKGAFNAADGSWYFQFDDWHYYNVSRWSFYHKELRDDAARFYSDYLPAGNYLLSYTAQAVAAGQFTKMPLHAEEMYEPDVYGKGLPGTLTVSELAEAQSE